MNPLLSKSFSLIRFPLIVMVLLIHVYDGAIMVNGEMIGTGNALVYNFLGRVFSKIFLVWQYLHSILLQDICFFLMRNLINKYI